MTQFAPFRPALPALALLAALVLAGCGDVDPDPAVTTVDGGRATTTTGAAGTYGSAQALVDAMNDAGVGCVDQNVDLGPSGTKYCEVDGATVLTAVLDENEVVGRDELVSSYEAVHGASMAVTGPGWVVLAQEEPLAREIGQALGGTVQPAAALT